MTHHVDALTRPTFKEEADLLIDKANRLKDLPKKTPLELIIPFHGIVKSVKNLQSYNVPQKAIGYLDQWVTIVCDDIDRACLEERVVDLTKEIENLNSDIKEFVPKLVEAASATVLKLKEEVRSSSAPPFGLVVAEEVNLKTESVKKGRPRSKSDAALFVPIPENLPSNDHGFASEIYNSDLSPIERLEGYTGSPMDWENLGPLMRFKEILYYPNLDAASFLSESDFDTFEKVILARKLYNLCYIDESLEIENKISEEDFNHLLKGIYLATIMMVRDEDFVLMEELNLKHESEFNMLDYKELKTKLNAYSNELSIEYVHHYVVELKECLLRIKFLTLKSHAENYREKVAKHSLPCPEIFIEEVSRSINDFQRRIQIKIDSARLERKKHLKGVLSDPQPTEEANESAKRAFDQSFYITVLSPILSGHTSCQKPIPTAEERLKATQMDQRSLQSDPQRLALDTAISELGIVKYQRVRDSIFADPPFSLEMDPVRKALIAEMPIDPSVNKKTAFQKVFQIATQLKINLQNSKVSKALKTSLLEAKASSKPEKKEESAKTTQTALSANENLLSFKDKWKDAIEAILNEPPNEATESALVRAVPILLAHGTVAFEKIDRIISRLSSNPNAAQEARTALNKAKFNNLTEAERKSFSAYKKEHEDFMKVLRGTFDEVIAQTSQMPDPVSQIINLSLFSKIIESMLK